MSELPRLVRTSFLEVAYDERGDPGAPHVVLLPDFPADARTYERVAGLLTDAGYRLLAPYLRGFGATRFLDEDPARSGQLVALGQDAVEFTDALNLTRRPHRPRLGRVPLTSWRPCNRSGCAS